MTNNNNTNGIKLDALVPAEMAQKAEAVGVSKANLDFWSMFILAILAGAFIAFGAEFYILVTTKIGLGFGIAKLIGGLVFSLGLILVVVAGAELFTGNNLIIMAWASQKVSSLQLLRNWGIVYLGNFIGSISLVMIMYYTRQWSFSGYAVGSNSLAIANAKVNLPFVAAFARGILCNVLVCLAVWLCFSARSVIDKIAAIIFPITAFVASGFEHSIANMYFIPMGMFLKSQPAVITAAGKTAADLANLNIQGFIRNLVPVTLGNIFGGGLLVGAIYWIIYLRHREENAADIGDLTETQALPQMVINLNQRTTKS